MRSALRSTNGSIVLLLGAGASLEAGVPHTAKMIQEINELLNAEVGDWKSYKPIYDHLKKLYGSKKVLPDGTIEYGDLNIEELVSNLDELVLLLDGTHNLSPFFKDFTELFKNLYGFRDIKSFRDKIEDKLKEWIMPNVMKLDYYQHLLKFAAENPSGLRVFTLNYDKCVEMAFEEYRGIENVYLERGFGINERQGCVWNTRNFDDYNERLKHLFLYKMHGSIDWSRNKKYELIKSNRTTVEELIFGTRQKVKAHDPYLYYVYQFRTYTLNANLIIVCGYGFGDEHINEILHQSLLNNPNQKILICRYPENDDEWPEALAKLSDSEREIFDRKVADQYIIPKRLKLDDSDQVTVHFGPAGDFFTKRLKMNEVELLFPEDDIEKQFFATTTAEIVEVSSSLTLEEQPDPLYDEFDKPF